MLIIVFCFTGHKLHVINMNQQSDSADLLGGYVVEIQKLLLVLVLGVCVWEWGGGVLSQSESSC